MTTFQFTGRSDSERFGERTLGDDPFGGTDGDDANYETAINTFPPAYDTNPNSLIDKYAEITGRLATDQDRDFDRLYNQRFLVSGGPTALQRYGEPFNVRRRTDESDGAFRTRIAAARRTSASTTTYEDIARVAVTVLETDNIQIDAAEATGGGTVRITAPAAAVTDSPFTRQQLEGLIGDGLPPTHTVDLVDDETFVLGATGDQGLGNGSLT